MKSNNFINFKEKKKSSIILMIIALIIILIVALSLYFAIPTRVKCVYEKDNVKETILATFKGNKLKFIESTKQITYQSNDEAHKNLNEHESSIEKIKNYGYNVKSKIDGKNIIIIFDGKVYDNDENFYNANDSIDVFVDEMKEKSYSCK